MNIQENIAALEAATSSKTFFLGNQKVTYPSPSKVLELWTKLLGEPNDVRLGNQQIMTSDEDTELITYNTYSLMTTDVEFESDDSYQPTIGVIIKVGRTPKIIIFSGMHNVRYCLNLCVWGADSKIELNSFDLTSFEGIIKILKENQNKVIETHYRMMSILQERVYTNTKDFNARFFEVLEQLAEDNLEKIITKAMEANREDERYSQMTLTDRRIYECITDTLKRFSPDNLLETTEKINDIFFG